MAFLVTHYAVAVGATRPFGSAEQQNHKRKAFHDHHSGG
jgi:hypothetical protein